MQKLTFQQMKSSLFSPHTLRITHQHVHYLRHKTNQESVFLQQPTTDILATPEHGVKENEIIECKINGHSILTYYCKIDHSGGGIPLYQRRQCRPGPYNDCQRNYIKKLMSYQVLGSIMKIRK
jgi:hypothetical protein